MANTGRIDIIGSNLNLPPKQAATWGVAQHKEAMAKAGYSGMAYYPVRGRMALELVLGVDAKDLVRAVHQPWRETTATEVAAIALQGIAALPRDAQAGKAALFEAALNAGMPRLEGSDGKLARIAHRVGRGAVPLVVHPYGQLLGDSKHARGSNGAARDYHNLSHDPRVGELQWQPSADFAHNRRVLTANPEQTAQDMAAIAHNDELGRAAFDTNHATMVRRDGRRFTNPEAMAAWFAANRELGVLEFALQPRFGSDVADLDKILNGNIADTPQGRLLAVAASNTPPDEDFHIKVEIPDYAFTGTDGRGLGMANSAEGHELLVPILYDYAVNNLPAAN